MYSERRLPLELVCKLDPQSWGQSDNFNLVRYIYKDCCSSLNGFSFSCIDTRKAPCKKQLIYKRTKAPVVQCFFELQVSQNKALLDHFLVLLLRFCPVRGLDIWYHLEKWQSLPTSECSHLTEISPCVSFKPLLQFPCISRKSWKNLLTQYPWSIAIPLTAVILRTNSAVPIHKFTPLNGRTITPGIFMLLEWSFEWSIPWR